MARTIADDVRDVFQTDPDWARYATVVAARRSEMGLTQEQIAAMGGPSTASMRQIEAGAQTNYRQHTLYGLDRALGWSPGSHLSVLAGRDPHVLIPAEQFRSKIAHAIEGAGTVVVEHQDVPVLRRDPDIERVLRALRRVGEENARNAAELNDALVALARALGQDE